DDAQRTGLRDADALLLMVLASDNFDKALGIAQIGGAADDVGEAEEQAECFGDFFAAVGAKIDDRAEGDAVAARAMLEGNKAIAHLREGGHEYVIEGDAARAGASQDGVDPVLGKRG